MIRPISAEVLWEIEITVRFSDTRRSACKTSFSVSTSRFAVISSSNRIDGSATAALAMDNN